VTTRGVNIATSKGMVVVVAQGNSGTSTKVSAIEIYNSGSIEYLSEEPLFRSRELFCLQQIRALV
jgi:hypothetical protein